MSNNNDLKEHQEKLGVICFSAALTTGGLGVRFEVTDERNTWPAFVVRHSKGLAAYINRCAHLEIELDWDQGHFFDVDERHIICATHGALYSPETGECVGGPCNGSGLEAVRVGEAGGIVYLTDQRYRSLRRETKFER